MVAIAKVSAPFSPRSFSRFHLAILYAIQLSSLHLNSLFLLGTISRKPRLHFLQDASDNGQHDNWLVL